MTPSHDYAITSPPGEVVAAGDAKVHQQALQLLDWNREDAELEGGTDVAYQAT